jgi:hypothetical protein
MGAPGLKSTTKMGVPGASLLGTWESREEWVYLQPLLLPVLAVILVSLRKRHLVV